MLGKSANSDDDRFRNPGTEFPWLWNCVSGRESGIHLGLSSGRDRRESVVRATQSWESTCDDGHVQREGRDPGDQWEFLFHVPDGRIAETPSRGTTHPTLCCVREPAVPSTCDADQSSG